jgi:hypothetical protein
MLNLVILKAILHSLQKTPNKNMLRSSKVIISGNCQANQLVLIRWLGVFLEWRMALRLLLLSSSYKTHTSE